MHVPLASPVDSYLAHKEEIDVAVMETLGCGDYILGRQVDHLESEFAAYLGVRSAVSVSSGTDALALSLRALNVGPGDEVITVSHTAVAVVSAIEQVGAIPILVDIERGFYTIDFRKVFEVTTANTAAVIAVHLYGQSVDMESAKRYQKETEIPVIEDCSQAHGASWMGQKLGTFGVLSAFSCYPTKNLGAFGDAGLITTQDQSLGERLRRLRQYGWIEKQRSLEPGVNSRMDELQAAVLRVQLRTLDRRNSRRQEIAARYLSGLSGLPLTFQTIRPRSEHVYHLFVCECAVRDELRNFLSQNDVQTGIHYPLPIHQQPAFQGRLRTSSLSYTEGVAKRVLSLPMFPEITDSQIDYVVDTIRRFPAFN